MLKCTIEPHNIVLNIRDHSSEYYGGVRNPVRVDSDNRRHFSKEDRKIDAAYNRYAPQESKLLEHPFGQGVALSFNPHEFVGADGVQCFGPDEGNYCGRKKARFYEIWHFKFFIDFNIIKEIKI